MGRVKAYIEVNGQKCWTLFDTGARNTYVVDSVAEKLLNWKFPQPAPVALGGKNYQVTQGCLLSGTVEGYWVETHARVVDEIGKDEEDLKIEILFGALAMQEWGINVDSKNECLDFTHYSREFVEF